MGLGGKVRLAWIRHIRCKSHGYCRLWGRADNHLLSEFCAIVQSKGIEWIIGCLITLCVYGFRTFHVCFWHCSTEHTCTLVGKNQVRWVLSMSRPWIGLFVSFWSCTDELEWLGNSRVKCDDWRMKTLFSFYWRGLHHQAVAASPPPSPCVSARKPLCLVVASLPYGSSCWWEWHCLKGTFSALSRRKVFLVS